MTTEAVLDQMADRLMQHNPFCADREAVRGRLLAYWAQRRCRVWTQGERVVGYLIWGYCDGPESAQRALTCEEAGPDLVLRAAYAAPGHRHLLWRMRHLPIPHRHVYTFPRRGGPPRVYCEVP